MYGKVKTADLMKGSGFDWMQRPNKGSMTRQEAVAPTPQQAIAQTSQTSQTSQEGPTNGNNKRQQYRATGAGGFTTYRDRDNKIHMVGVPGATILPGQGRSSFTDDGDARQGKYHVNFSDSWNPQFNPGNTMPTRRGTAATQGTGAQPLSEQELEDFQQQEQEPNQPIKNFNEYGKKAKAEAQKIADERAGGETNPTPAPIDRHQRSQVDETKADPEEVKALQDSLGLDVQGGNSVSGYDDILAMMRANTVNEGDMVRRQHSREIVTGLGDLVSSIANLWATTKGAPNSYDNSKGMTATSQSRYDRELARRKAQNEQILNYYRVKKAAEDDERIRKYREDIDAREQRRLDEAERHNKEMERLAAEKEQNNKEAKAEEQERKNKDSENKRNNDNKRANAYVAGQNKKGKGSTKKSRKSSSSNTPPSRRRGNSNGNNTRPSKRK